MTESKVLIDSRGEMRSFLNLAQESEKFLNRFLVIRMPILRDARREVVRRRLRITGKHLETTGCGKIVRLFREGYDVERRSDIGVLLPPKVASPLEVFLIGVPDQMQTARNANTVDLGRKLRLKERTSDHFPLLLIEIVWEKFQNRENTEGISGAEYLIPQMFASTLDAAS